MPGKRKHYNSVIEWLRDQDFESLYVEELDSDVFTPETGDFTTLSFKNRWKDTGIVENDSSEEFLNQLKKLFEDSGCELKREIQDTSYSKFECCFYTWLEYHHPNYKKSRVVLMTSSGGEFIITNSDGKIFLEELVKSGESTI